MTAFLLTFIFTLALLLWLVSIPVEVDLEIDTLAEKKTRLRLFWLYGLVNYTAGKKEKKKRSISNIDIFQKNSRVVKKGAKRSGQFALAMFACEGFSKRLVRMLLDCLCSIKFRRSRFYCQFGLSDPADTGRCFGTITPLLLFLRQGPILNTQIEANYMEQVFFIQGGSRLRIVPFYLLAIFTLFLLSKEFWGGIRAGLKANKH